jgi:hypothetical protein
MRNRSIVAGRRHAIAAFVLITLMSSLTAALVAPANASTASDSANGAAPAQTADSAGPTLVEATKSGVSPQAWECPSGDFCVWENTGGTGRRCNWDVADPDWWAGSVVCSWADDTPVESALDNGNVSRFLAVRVYRSANEQNSFACLRRGVLYNITAGGVRLRSHEWVTYYC